MILKSLTREELGRFGESVASQIFRKAGFTYVSLCEMSRKGAPMADGERKIVLPDFDIAQLQAYVDVKVKTQSTLYRRTGRRQHGINKRNYHDYEMMGSLSRRNCGLMVIELFDDDGAVWSGSILAESFRHLGKPREGINESVQKVYWDRDRFSLVGSHSELELEGIGSGNDVPQYKTQLMSIFHSLPERCAFHPREMYVDEPPRAGRIRTHCGVCGVFIGYRPVIRGNR